MPMNRKKKLGLALIAFAVLGAGTLHFSGVDIVETTNSQMTGSMTFIMLKFHWSMLLFGMLALVGFVGVVMSARKSSG